MSKKKLKDIQSIYENGMQYIMLGQAEELYESELRAKDGEYKALDNAHSKVNKGLREIIDNLQKEIAQLKQPKIIKLLPQFIEKVKSCTKTLHIKNRHLPFGIYEIKNGETGEDTGVFIEIFSTERHLWNKDFSWLESHICVVWKSLGFDDYPSAREFYFSYLEHGKYAYLYQFRIVEMPETRQ